MSLIPSSRVCGWYPNSLRAFSMLNLNPAKRNGSIFQNEASAFSEKAQNETSNKKRNTQHV